MAGSRLNAWELPRAAPQGAPWMTVQHRLMHYKNCGSLAIRQRRGGKQQIASAKYPPNTPLLTAYQAAFRVMEEFEAGVITDRASLKRTLKEALGAAVV
eukprot:4314765-Amphidinium_carterae.1